MSKAVELKERIQEYLNEFLAGAEVQVVELNIVLTRNNVLVQVLADRPRGGITVDECSDLNKKVSRRIEQEALILGPYTVEVSSPGLDRPLRSASDFMRVEGREVRVYLSEAIENKLELIGTVTGTRDTEIVLNDQTREIIIPLRRIHKGIQII